ncbi:hypothetical protein BJ170DRAFT_260425 [Xylariales sp. AK1849]|nr:hypothetical protein BJ170DRAFT_260425 [Xylariales sp. AK1849]
MVSQSNVSDNRCRMNDIGSWLSDKGTSSISHSLMPRLVAGRVPYYRKCMSESEHRDCVVALGLRFDASTSSSPPFLSFAPHCHFVNSQFLCPEPNTFVICARASGRDLDNFGKVIGTHSQCLELIVFHSLYHLDPSMKQRQEAIDIAAASPISLPSNELESLGRICKSTTISSNPHEAREFVSKAPNTDSSHPKGGFGAPSEISEISDRMTIPSSISG